MAEFLRLVPNARPELLRLNPWVSGLENGILAGSSLIAPECRAARREASLSRLGSGAFAWNTWAQAMSGLRGKVASDPDLSSLWRFLADTDLTDEAFERSFDAAGYVFPGNACFDGAAFSGDAWFSAVRFMSRVSFRTATFSRDAFFDKAEFSGNVDFGEARFMRGAEFRVVRSAGTLGFAEVEFGRDAWFRGSHFDGPVDFHGTSFVGEAGLGACVYAGPADFSQVTFGDNAGFDQAVFEQAVTFAEARFGRVAWFNKAEFRAEAVFDRARFLGKMHFDDIVIADRGSPVAAQLDALLKPLRGGLSG